MAEVRRRFVVALRSARANVDSGGAPSPDPAVERLGIFGGTFDPPHLGHLIVASEAKWACRFDELLVMVAHDPWQKRNSRPVSAASIRLEMVPARLRRSRRDHTIVTGDRPRWRLVLDRHRTATPRPVPARRTRARPRSGFRERPRQLAPGGGVGGAGEHLLCRATGSRGQPEFPVPVADAGRGRTSHRSLEYRGSQALRGGPPDSVPGAGRRANLHRRARPLW